MVDLNSTLNYLNVVFDKINPLINRITYALLILLVGFVAARIVGGIIKRVLHAFDVDKRIEKRIKYEFSLESFISTITTYAIYVTSIILSLRVLGFSKALLVIILLGLLFMVLIIILFSLKELMTDLLGSVAARRKYGLRVGQWIKFRNVKGKLVKIGVFETYLKTRKGEDIFIPNALFWKQNFNKIRKVGKEKLGKLTKIKKR